MTRGKQSTTSMSVRKWTEFGKREQEVSEERGETTRVHCVGVEEGPDARGGKGKERGSRCEWACACAVHTRVCCECACVPGGGGCGWGNKAVSWTTKHPPLGPHTGGSPQQTWQHCPPGVVPPQSPPVSRSTGHTRTAHWGPCSD